jgi:hypothetical protein
MLYVRSVVGSLKYRSVKFPVNIQFRDPRLGSLLMEEFIELACMTHRRLAGDSVRTQTAEHCSSPGRNSCWTLTHQAIGPICPPAVCAQLNPVCHLLALLGAHHILHVSRIRVKCYRQYCNCVWTGIAQSVQRESTGWVFRGSDPGGGKRIFLSPYRPCAPPSLLYNRYRVSLPEM